MQVFVAGASGAIGTRLVAQLIARRHKVIGTCRSPANAQRVRALGAEPILLDLLDTRVVRTAVRDIKPEAIIHQTTALADLRDFKHIDRSIAQTNRLRTEAPTRSSPPRARAWITESLRNHACEFFNGDPFRHALAS